MKVGFKFSESFCRHLLLQRLPYLAPKYDLSPWLFRLFISSSYTHLSEAHRTDLARKSFGLPNSLYAAIAGQMCTR
jgi:hypothetical protein